MNEVLLKMLIRQVLKGNIKIEGIKDEICKQAVMDRLNAQSDTYMQ